MIAHTTAFVIPVVAHWLEQEIPQYIIILFIIWIFIPYKVFLLDKTRVD